MTKSISEQLNSLYLKHFSFDISNLKPIKFIEQENTGVTIVQPNVTAFKLNPAIGRSIVHYENSNIINNLAVFRSNLGLILASRMVENETLFVFTVSMLINEGLNQLTKETGNLNGREVTTKRVGSESGPFRDLEDTAALEFRILARFENE